MTADHRLVIGCEVVESAALYIAPSDDDLDTLAFERYVSRDDVLRRVAKVDGRIVGYLGMEIRKRLTRVAPEVSIPNPLR
ncbi:MAG: hypothetical protein WEB06_12940 [Actinomycetota bacterium]